MQRVSEVIEQHPGDLTKNQVAVRAGGRKETTLLGIDILIREGYVTSAKGSVILLWLLRLVRGARAGR